MYLKSNASFTLNYHSDLFAMKFFDNLECKVFEGRLRLSHMNKTFSLSIGIGAGGRERGCSVPEI